MRAGIILILILIVASCGKERNEGGEYGGKVLSWFNKGFKENSVLELNEDIFYLYYNDAATCETCKLQLFEMLKSRSDLMILTSFENDIEVSFFKEAYKIENEVINYPGFRDNILVYPFLFQTKNGSSFHNIYIFNDENLNEVKLNDYFEYIKDNRVVFY